MPKLRCPCGFVHDLSPVPDHGWKTVRDRDYEEVIAAERRRDEISGIPKARDGFLSSEFDKLTGSVISKTGLLYLCPECGRLMWRKERDGIFLIFKPDHPDGQAGEQ